MTLRRTAGALASMHVFYKADVVVFCEGGQPKSHAEALKYSNDGRTLDGVFWSSIISVFLQNKSLHFKSVGSKSTLLSISNDVHNNGINTVTICLDSDYDRILCKQSSNNRLAYTWGYSWETDVLQGAIVEEILAALVGAPPDELIALLRSSISQFESDLARWCEVDISLKHRNKPCVLDRKNPLSSVDINSFPVSIAQQRLLKRLKEECGYKIKPRRIRNVSATEVRRLVYGKLISKAYYHIIITIAKRIISDVKIEYDNVMRLAINFTIRDILAGNGRDLHDHYLSQSVSF